MTTGTTEMNDKMAERSFKKLTLRETADRLTAADNILILCHTNPDGDAIGSASALCELMRSMGKTVTVAAPSAVPKRLSILMGNDTFLFDGNAPFDTLVTVDTASPIQLGELSCLAERTDLMIDHHSSGTPYADALIVPDAAACGEIIFDLAKMLERDGAAFFSGSVARALYGAVTSDTGSFKFSNTTPKTFTVASELLRIISDTDGMAADEISRLLHDTVTESDMAADALVASKAELFENGSLCGVLLTADEITSKGLKNEDLGGAVDVPRKLENVLVAFALRQDTENREKFKLSSRANCPIDVSAVCAAFGGGGHQRAAGATLTASSPNDAYLAAVSAFSKAVAEYKTERMPK